MHFGSGQTKAAAASVLSSNLKKADIETNRDDNNGNNKDDGKESDIDNGDDGDNSGDSNDSDSSNDCDNSDNSDDSDNRDASRLKINKAAKIISRVSKFVCFLGSAFCKKFLAFMQPFLSTKTRNEWLQ